MGYLKLYYSVKCEAHELEETDQASIREREAEDE